MMQNESIYQHVFWYEVFNRKS